MSWITVKIADVLKQYRIEHRVQNDTLYKQVSILNDGSVVLRGEKIGKEIGRKRQFLIDVKKYPRTLIFTRQLLLQGSIGIANEEVHNCIVTENMPMFSIDDSKIALDYLALFLKSEVFKKQVRKVELTGSAQKSIHEKTFLELEIPLPSLNEQNEIINSYSKFNSLNLSARSEHTYQQDLVKQLRQSFLREAMQGKLVKQNLKDENAKDLLEKNKAEKLKALSPIQEDEIPFSIPENWLWCRGEIVAVYIDPQPSHRTPPRSKDGVPYIAMSDIRKDGSLDFASSRKVSFSVLEEHKNRYTLKAGDFIFGKIGTIGKPVLLPEPFNYTLCANVILIQPNRNIIDDKYLYYFLSSPIAERFLIEKKSTTSYPVFGMHKARNMLIPLPPFKEQKRIVKKLEEVLNLCEELKSTITDNQNYTDQLLQVALKDALQPKEMEAV